MIKFYLKHIMLIDIIIFIGTIISMIFIESILLCIFNIILLIIPFFNKKLPLEACTYVGWHLEPNSVNVLNAFQPIGTCPRCGKSVMLDSQGNWF